jgi:hypothetical protein
MNQTQQFLYKELSKLPLEEVGKAISYIRFLEQEPEPVLLSILLKKENCTTFLCPVI